MYITTIQFILSPSTTWFFYLEFAFLQGGHILCPVTLVHMLRHFRYTQQCRLAPKILFYSLYTSFPCPDLHVFSLMLSFFGSSNPRLLFFLFLICKPCKNIVYLRRFHKMQFLCFRLDTSNKQGIEFHRNLAMY